MAENGLIKSQLVSKLLNMAFYDLMTYQQIIKSMDKMNEKRENEVI